MSKLKEFRVKTPLIIFLALFWSLGMWSLGWISARMYFATKIERDPVVIQAPSLESMLLLVNKERRTAGLKVLYLDERLMDAARAKSCDMQHRGYFDHKDPDGNKGWHFIDEQGVAWVDAGENIAKGTTDPATLIQNWMESEGHRKNILDKKFRYVGYASCGQFTTQFFTQ